MTYPNLVIALTAKILCYKMIPLNIICSFIMDLCNVTNIMMEKNIFQELVEAKLKSILYIYQQSRA